MKTSIWAGVLAGLMIGAGLWTEDSAVLFLLASFPVLFYAISSAGPRASKTLIPGILILSLASTLAYNLPLPLAGAQATLLVAYLVDLFREVMAEENEAGRETKRVR